MTAVIRPVAGCCFGLFTLNVAAIGVPDTFDQAELIAAQQRSQFHEYHGQFMAYYGAKYAAVINNCLAATKSKPRRQLAFVLVIEQSGKALKILSTGDSRLFACIEPTLMADKFPAPPTSPYMEHFRISAE